MGKIFSGGSPPPEPPRTVKGLTAARLGHGLRPCQVFLWSQHFTSTPHPEAATVGTYVDVVLLLQMLEQYVPQFGPSLAIKRPSCLALHTAVTDPRFPGETLSRRIRRA